MITTGHTLRDANTIADIIEYYPSSWIKQYKSVEVTTSKGDLIKKSVGPDQRLTTEQKEILKNATVGSEINIKVLHKSKNPITSEIEHHEMNTTMTLIPDQEASYPGGQDELIAYLKEGSVHINSASNYQGLSFLRIFFTVNTQGQVEGIQVDVSSTNTTLDQTFVDLIKRMPKWNPALDIDGAQVSQEFELFIGPDGC